MTEQGNAGPEAQGSRHEGRPCARPVGQRDGIGGRLAARSDRIKAILADQDFQWAIERLEAQLTRKVMASATTEEDRAAALHTYHGLQAAKGIASQRGI